MTFYRLYKLRDFLKTEESLNSLTFINIKLLEVRVFAFVSFAYELICQDKFYK
jgi:hypothetical protein